MSAQLRHQLHVGEQVHQPFSDGVVATVSAADGTTVVSVSRHVEPAPADCGPDESLTVVTVIGEIDCDTAPLLQVALTHALNGRPRVCCDMAGVTFFGAAGANTVLAAYRQATEQKHVFFLRGVTGIAALVMQIVDPDRRLVR